LFLREFKVGRCESATGTGSTFLEHLQHHPTYYSVYKDEHEQA